MSRGFAPPFQLLELNVISAQDLAKVSRKMKTYVVAWVHPDRKLSTRVDIQGHNNPTWNDKFVFRVDDEFLYGQTSAIMIEIYALHWFRDIHVGTIRVIVGNLVPPPQLHRQHRQHHVQLGMRFVALQVRRRSGCPQGILNIGVALLDTSMRSMPLYTQNASAIGYRHLMGEKDPQMHNDNHRTKDDEKNSDSRNQFLLPWNPKPELRRTKSDTSSMIGSDAVAKKMLNKKKAGSMVNGSAYEKQNSNPSSVITDSEIFKNYNKGKPHSTSSGSVYGTLTKAKYRSNVSGGNITKVKNKIHSSLIDDNSSSTFKKFDLGKLHFGTPKNMNLNGGAPFITESDLGPSASEVAAAMITRKKNHYVVEETEGDIMTSWGLESSMEGLQSKLERWRTDLPVTYDRSGLSTLCSGSRGLMKHNTSDSDSDSDVVFSCFGAICGVECSIVCGGSPRGNNPSE
ncbi:hypothetical protein P3X46_006346 [Hevea brasiliensis]|uniref:C2 domain-containing protein n=1 Tax=Hevea brasiliensis TaxID=3981 RepID=A0ABQ9MPX7_HEVBR|nr:uncharacterized protein LOC110657914 [Hevea brasiliensis]KAJ9182342.1 hypothetical protein P3X46_006346 [Hevea brasiliensis]